STLLRENLYFDGHLDATLTASSYSKKPSVQGEINVVDLRVKNHFIGDVDITSKYDRQMDRLAAKLVAISDTTVAVENAKNPNVVVEGYYDPEAVKARKDSAFYFQADFNALDTWFLSLILEDIIANIKGPATGTGVIFGNGENLTYHADLQLQDIFIKPAFVNTRWHLNGPVQLSSDSGVDINNVDITDENGGTGTLYGNVDLKNENGTYLDLHLRLNNLKAMNSPFGPDMPFYGDLSASGTLNLV